MSTKCSFDFITPLFIGVDVTPEGEVVVICSLDMKVEAESLLSHFGLYAAYIFGSVLWEAFTVEYKFKMDYYQYCPIKCCAVEIDNSSIDSDKSVDREFARRGFTNDVLVKSSSTCRTSSQFTFAPISLVFSKMRMKTLLTLNQTCPPPLPPPKQLPPIPSNT